MMIVPTMNSDVGRDERAPPADDVADAAGDRHDRDERDEVGVDDPGGVIEAVGQPEPEVADDRSQHRGDDREVVGSNEDREADGCQDGAWRGLAAPNRQRTGAVTHRARAS